MARPTDPAKLAALRARQAAASAAYRARQRVAQASRVPRGGLPHGAGIVKAAQAHAESLRDRRAEILTNLPDVRNPAVTIRPIERTKREAPPKRTKAAQQRTAAAIRERANAEKIAAIGKARKDQLRIELTDGSISEQLQEMDAMDRARFRELAERISAGSAQSIGILFEHTGGQKIYSAAIERILYKTSREEGFDMLEMLAEYAEAAAKLYAPSRIGRITV